MSQLHISAKQLGNLALENFCPRCLYMDYKLNLKYQGMIFPGILSKMDAIQKKSVVKYYDKYGHLPNWLESEGIIGKPKICPGPKTFFTSIKGVILSGSIDLLIETPSKELIIIDFKTASPKDGYDPFMPVYNVQLQGYAKITEDLNLGKVVGLYLVYFSAQTSVTLDNIDSYVRTEDLEVSFDVVVKKLELNPEQTIGLLVDKFKNIITGNSLPERHPDCIECDRLEKIFTWLASSKVEIDTRSEELPLDTRGLMIEN